ncbi:30S ribosomal protein S8 [Bacilli bacterium]|nr:30S ribosomal protein S8 [Bacilli bacterium]
MFVDPIADLITKIKNAINVKQSSIVIHSSKFTSAICETLKTNGYILDYVISQVENKKNVSITTITLKYLNKFSAINGIEQISKPGLRIYTQAEKTYKIKNGLGMAIISTSEGILTDKQVRAKKIGGEVIVHIW